MYLGGSVVELARSLSFFAFLRETLEDSLGVRFKGGLAPKNFWVGRSKQTFYVCHPILGT